MLELAILVLLCCGRGLGLLLYSSLTLEGTHAATLPHHHLPRAPVDQTSGSAFFVDTNTVHHLFLNPYTTQNPQANPQNAQTLLPDAIAVQNLIVNPNAAHNLIDPSILHGHDDAPQPDYQGHVAPYAAGESEHRTNALASKEPLNSEGQQHIQESDPSVSPYYADPEGRLPSPTPPTTTAEDLTPPPTTCREPPVACNSSARYRSISGRCNNLLYPHLGTPGQPMPRILPPVHDAALMRTRSASGGLLPNPRVVSLVSQEAPTAQPTQHNLLIMQLGQFIDHDMIVVPVVKRRGSKESRVCEECESWREPQCAPIPIPEDDPHLRSHQYYTGQRRCLPLTRSGGVGGRDALARLTIDQVNINTAFLDLSTVYGSDECRVQALRLHNEGLMTEALTGFLPMEDGQHFEECRSHQKKCFIAGDDRCNEHLGLLAIHMIFFREHNRLAKQLSRLNPHWDDERIFQEARRINIAQYQHILYSEYLPVLLGTAKVAEYRLSPEKSGYYKGYDDRVNQGVLNEFATAAFRVGHTMVPEDLLLLDSYYMPEATIPLVHTFHNSTMAFLPGMCDKVMRGLVGTRLRPVDLTLVAAILDKLFKGQQIPGQDLFARNIARGRDHSIPAYVKYRAACGEGPTATFDDLLQVMTQQTVAALRKAYSHVEDVDLYTGGLAEQPVAGGLVGPTFACIIAYQFLNSRRGDRFWYENADNGLTFAQLNAIRSSATFSRLLCENMDEEDGRMPPKIFFLPSKRENSLQLCDRLPSVDLSPWQEQQFPLEVECSFQGQLHPPNRYVHVSKCLVCLCLSHGQMRCKPHLTGCKHSDNDEYCRLLC
ncbi:LOW QUALITY PROTEIN: salivary peroxidase/catechol oxidase-like [Panulirus ornatus]|uniref:LOW QUALITY PROTEIN: salivary peroxidase/catechol oxidase-like n=1 Tax=Panulirus ornatus TaxID=150431 RepID=UPI003A871A79